MQPHRVIKKPSADSFPYIDRAFKQHYTSFESLDSDVMKGLISISDEALEFLSDQVKLSYKRIPLKNQKAILGMVPQHKTELFEEYEWYFSQEEIRASIITCAQSKVPSDWAQFVDKYNALSATGQAGVDMYFETTQQSLDSILSAADRIFRIPEHLRHPVQTCEFSKRKFCRSEDGRWLREDVYSQQFYVEFVYQNDQVTHTEFMGYAGNPEDAIILAILKASSAPKELYREYDPEDHDGFEENGKALICRYAKIYRSGKEASLIAMADTPKTLKKAGVYLEWRRSIGVDQAAKLAEQAKELSHEASLESMWDNFNSASQLRHRVEMMKIDITLAHSPIADKFMSMLDKIEKKIGGPRSNRRFLEEDLGL